MRAASYLILISLTALQSLIVWYWTSTPAGAAFSGVFKAFCGGVPQWSALVFRLGGIWFIVPMMGIAALVVDWRKKPGSPFLWKVCLASLVATVLMIYSMYPLRLMFGGCLDIQSVNRG